MRYKSHSIFIFDLFSPKLVNSELVETLAKLADSVWNHGNLVKDLGCDRVNNIEQLRKHFPVELQLSISFDKRFARGSFSFSSFKAWSFWRFWITGRFLDPCFDIVHLFPLKVDSLQILDREEACVDAFALHSEKVVETAASVIRFSQLFEKLL